MGETNFVNRATSVLNVEISSDVLDRMVRTALRRGAGGGPVGWLVGNAAPTSAQSSERTVARRRETLVRWISDELRRWSQSRRAALDGAGPRRPPQGLSESFSAT